MAYNHRMPGNRAINPDQEALIARALKTGNVTDGEVGVLVALEMYGSPENSERARQALAAANKVRGGSR